MQKNRLYWLLQILGWSLYVVLASTVIMLSNGSISKETTINLFIAYSVGIFVSHQYRNALVKLRWPSMKLKSLIPRVFLGAVVSAITFELIYLLVKVVFNIGEVSIDESDIIQNILNWFILMLMWSMIYFLFHFFNNYKKEEIKNLQWEAQQKEIQLNKLKSQLNPHFIFNSMNTIRALIDEDPAKAKKCVTQLSNILRNSLLMGEKKAVSFEEELRIVKDYLEIEQTRFEERLRVDFEIEDATLNRVVPLLMVQTLVENGIKHGISKFPSGGLLKIKAYLEKSDLKIEIENPGFYNEQASSETGFGVKNSRQRLNILFGDKASLNFVNLQDNKVQTELLIPREIKL